MSVSILARAKFSGLWRHRVHIHILYKSHQHDIEIVFPHQVTLITCFSEQVLFDDLTTHQQITKRIESNRSHLDLTYMVGIEADGTTAMAHRS